MKHHVGSIRVRDDEGVALLTVIGVISVLTLLVIGTYNLASQSFTVDAKNDAESQAFQVANAGIDTVYADLSTNAGTEVVLSHYDTPRAITVGAGSAEVTLEQEGGIEYVATSVGTAADGTTETIKVRFYYMNLWEMFIAAGEDDDSIGGGQINGNASVDGPFYVRGDLDSGGSSSFTRGPLFVTGSIGTLGGGGTLTTDIGTTSEPIDVYVGGTYPTTFPANKNFHAKRVSNSVPTITAPALDQAFMDAALSRAKLESCDNVMGTPEFVRGVNIETLSGTGNAAEYPTAIDATWTRPKATNATMWYKVVDSSPDAPMVLGEGTTDLVIGGTGSFGSWQNDGHGYAAGQWDDFAYDDDNDILYLEGTIFVDGDVTFNEDIQYRGNGALVVNGDVQINGQLVPYGTDTTNDMAADRVLGIISASSIYVQGDGNWGPWNTCGALYARNSLDFTKQNVNVKGSIIAPQINFPNANFHLESDPELPTFLPWSMPGRDTPVLVIGAWSRS